MTTDEQLEADVVEGLCTEPAARKSKIYVRARDGTVTLVGQVNAFGDKLKIDGAVSRVPGVKLLDTQISIKRFASITPKT